MKNIIFKISIVALFITFATQLFLVAQEIPLKPKCAAPDCDAPWKWDTIHLECGTCCGEVIATYGYRTCQNIKEITLSYFKGSLLFGVGSCCKFSDVLKKITDSIVGRGRTNFGVDIKEGECEDTWRLSASACWASLPTGIGTYGQGNLYAGCEGGCCFVKLKVCKRNGKLVVDRAQAINPSLEAPPALPYVTCSEPCGYGFCENMLVNYLPFITENNTGESKNNTGKSKNNAEKTEIDKGIVLTKPDDKEFAEAKVINDAKVNNAELDTEKIDSERADTITNKKQ